MPTITIRISRFKPGVIDPPAFSAYELSYDEGWSVLDALEQIRIHQEPSLMYRRSCHHASCGTCACTINGTERLACTTLLADIQTPVVTVEPLRCFRRWGDLVTHRSTLLRPLQAHGPGLQPDTQRKRRALLMTGREQPATTFEGCIECGCCVAACPVAHKNRRFIGPAALAAINKARKQDPSAATALLDLAAQSDGEPMCQRALACSRVCPSAVYPARHIAELRRQRRDNGAKP